MTIPKLFSFSNSHIIFSPSVQWMPFFWVYFYLGCIALFISLFKLKRQLCLIQILTLFVIFLSLGIGFTRRTKQARKPGTVVFATTPSSAGPLLSSTSPPRRSWRWRGPTRTRLASCRTTPGNIFIGCSFWYFVLLLRLVFFPDL